MTWHIGRLEVVDGHDVVNEQAAKDNKVKISSSGKITADKKSAGEGIFRVWAVSKKDNSIVSDPIDVAILSEVNIKSLEVADNKKSFQVKVGTPVGDLLSTIFVNGSSQLAKENPFREAKFSTSNAERSTEEGDIGAGKD